VKRWRETWWFFLTLFPLALLGWGAFVYAGARARKRSWIAWGVVYFALTAFGWLAAQAEDDSTVDNLAGPVILLVWVATIVHALVLRPAYLDRRQLEAKLDRAEDRLEEREEARRLAEDDPARALELGVGRPDLDGFAGGLVDLNNAPAAAIEELPGVNRELAERIVLTRAELGGFSSLDDLGHVLELPVSLVDRIRADVVLLPRGTESS
jgi:Helix-hairpin-helix motif